MNQPPEINMLSVGDVVGTAEIQFDRARLVRYAGASGDFNPIHWDESAAQSVGLPGVIAHGMLTMGAVVDVVTRWAGRPDAILDYQTRFTRPVPVPAAGTVVVEVSAAVGAIDLAAGTARVDVTVVHAGTRVLGKCQAQVRLSPPRSASPEDGSLST